MILKAFCASFALVLIVGTQITTSFSQPEMTGVVSASASTSSNGKGSTVTVNYPGKVVTDTIPPGGTHHVTSSGSSIGVRGSFGGQDDSVGIEVNGGSPAGANAYGYSGYAPAATPYWPSPYISNVPAYNAYNNPFQNFFQQQFAALQAQQQALQAQIQAQQQAIWDQTNRIDNRIGYGDYSSSGPQFASSSINLGPSGGYGSGQIGPVKPGIASRFGESIPAPSGNSFGVFSSSSSSSSVGPDGKPISHKSSTIGVNDNGKVTYQTVHDP